MSNAFKCDLCSEFYEGIPDHIPETWALGKAVMVEMEQLALGVECSVEMRVDAHSSQVDICDYCMRGIIAQALSKLLEREGKAAARV